jgi:hypothetical protein
MIIEMLLFMVYEAQIKMCHNKKAHLNKIVSVG